MKNVTEALEELGGWLDWAASNHAAAKAEIARQRRILKKAREALLTLALSDAGK